MKKIPGIWNSAINTVVIRYRIVIVFFDMVYKNKLKKILFAWMMNFITLEHNYFIYQRNILYKFTL